MKTRQLEVFHAIYTRGTITEAATFLNVSQPSISKVLAHTESQLGFLLFSRIKGRLFPTPEADAIFLKADKINTGHGFYGWTLSFASGKIISNYF